MNALTPYLAVADGARALAFYQEALGAQVIETFPDAAGRLTHATLAIGDARLFVSDEYPDSGAVSPERLGGSPVLLVLEVADVDTTLERALAAGAALVRQPQDGFDGALRTAKFDDPLGHRWMLTRSRRA